MEADRILEMIENVDPADDDTLDEIDARFWCFAKTHFYQHTLERNGTPKFNELDFDKTGYRFGCKRCPKYTRSLDAIKAAEEKELEGWVFSMHSFLPSGEFKFIAINMNNNIYDKFTPFLPTEYLARLHAVTQSIQWKRDND